MEQYIIAKMIGKADMSIKKYKDIVGMDNYDGHPKPYYRPDQKYPHEKKRRASLVHYALMKMFQQKAAGYFIKSIVDGWFPRYFSTFFHFSSLKLGSKRGQLSVPVSFVYN